MSSSARPAWLRQLGRFLISGSLAAGIDIGLYLLLLDGLGVYYAKAISFTAATIATFLLNKYWTFEKQAFARREIVLYVLFYSVSILLNALVNGSVAEYTNHKLFAFLVATGFSTVFNFLGLKLIVFQ